jgi:hypothetical protein
MPEGPRKTWRFEIGESSELSTEFAREVLIGATGKAGSACEMQGKQT